MSAPSSWFNRRGWRDIIIGSPYAWLILFFLLPFVIVVVMSFAKSVAQSPPFAFLPDWPFAFFGNYARLWSKSLYVRSFFISLWNAGVATVLCLLLGYPMALGLTRVPKTMQRLLLMLVVLPFWTSFLLRVYAWMGLMGTNSWFNRLLTTMYNLLVPDSWRIASIQMMHTNFAVVLVMVYSFLPFMILPLYANLKKLDQTLDEAAMDLGSRPWQVFKDVTLPLSIPGIIAGGLLVFIPASGELVIPSLVGNVSDPMIGYVISQEFGSNHDWPMASSIAVALLLFLVVPLMAYSHFEARAGGARQMKRMSTFLISMMCFGFAFFYVPIISMIFFSFNRSRLVTLWGGFSVEWYGKLLDNPQILDAAVLSLEIALLSATISTILGTMAGITLARFKRFRGRTLFAGLITAPLIMPEWITGVSSLLLFIMMAQWIGWPGQRGFTTILIAHITFTMTYVTTIIQSRLSSMDSSVEEAAMDLGSKPWQVLADVTLPIISPAIMSGWLLAFTISLDDVVITSFTTGPGYNTLPMVIWSKVKLGVTPDINALASIIVAVVAVGVAVAAFILTRAERQRERDIQLAIAANQ